MKSFWDRYLVNREVWEDCYLGFIFEYHSLATRDAGSVSALLVNSVVPMPVGGGARLSKLEPSCLRKVSTNDGISLAERTLSSALNYSSNCEMPIGEPSAVVAEFFATFQNPFVYTNALPDSNAFNSTTEHTADLLICCVDEQQLGCILTCEDE